MSLLLFAGRAEEIFEHLRRLRVELRMDNNYFSQGVPRHLRDALALLQSLDDTEHTFKQG